MNLALDTNRYTDLRRGDKAVSRKLAAAEVIRMPFIVLGELRSGFQGGSRGEENERQLSEFLDHPRVWTLEPDEDTTLHYALLYQQLRRLGTPIPTNDLWIAALVVQHGLTLYARDKHFDHLPQVPRI